VVGYIHFVFVFVYTSKVSNSLSKILLQNQRVCNQLKQLFVC
jgi:hypothetical protein